MLGVSSLFFGEMGCVPALCLLKIQWKLLVRFLNSGVVQYTLEGVFGEKACQYNIWGRCCGSVVCVAELDWDQTPVYTTQIGTAWTNKQ